MPKHPLNNGFSLAIAYYREEDGRWLADIPALPGVTAYGRTKKKATGTKKKAAGGRKRAGTRAKKPPATTAEVVASMEAPAVAPDDGNGRKDAPVAPERA